MMPAKRRLLPFYAALASLLGLLAAFAPSTVAVAATQAADSTVNCPAPDAPDLTPAEWYDLGKAYEQGLCQRSVDIAGATAWYERAALKGHALAAYALGELAFTGRGDTAAGVPDYPRAKRWYETAAQKGHGPSQLRLGFLNAEAHFKGVTTDLAAAESWFMKAAEQDAGDARFRLGNFYLHYKRPPEPGKALIWLKKAAEGGHRVAMFDLARLLMDGAPPDVAAHPTLGVEWLEKAAKADLLQAQVMLAELYTNGRHVEKSPAKALVWLLRIAGQPTASALHLNQVADILFEGRDGLPKNYPTALKYYLRSATKGDRHAAARLSEMYTQGLGTTADPDLAAKYKAQAEKK